MKCKAFTFPCTMQAASVCSRTGSYLPSREGQPLLPSHCSAFVSYSVWRRWDQTGTPFTLDALLLLLMPFVFTFTAFVALPLFADAVHQLTGNSGYPLSRSSLSAIALFSPFNNFNISFIDSAVASGLIFLSL